jgi:hypothetical protein
VRTLATAVSLVLMTVATGALELNTMVESIDAATVCWRGSQALDHRLDEVEFGLRYDRDTVNDHENFYSFALRALRRDGTEATAQGYCEDRPFGAIECMVECDGGSVMVRQGDEGLLALSVEAGRYLRLSEDCSGAKFDLLPEDGVLHVEPRDTQRCLAVRDPDWEDPSID